MSDAKNVTAMIVTMVAETHIHPGIGQSTGALDLPVARESTTQYPFVPGSGVKGAMRVWAEERTTGLDPDKLFGKQTQPDSGGVDGAGSLLCSDARLLLLPVRCLSDAYKWVTCPAILRRLQRDLVRAGYAAPDWTIPAPQPGKYFGPGEEDAWLGLEEREFANAGAVDPKITALLGAILGTEMAQGLADKLVILSDRDFTWFAQYGLPIMARNDLDDNKVSKNLWYEESLAPDTILYALFGERARGQVQALVEAIAEVPYVQMGGNETIGQGWFKMLPYEGGTA